MTEDIYKFLSRIPLVVTEIPQNFDYSDPKLYQIGVHQNIDVTLCIAILKGNNF